MDHIVLIKNQIVLFIDFEDLFLVQVELLVWTFKVILIVGFLKSIVKLFM